MLLLVMLLLLLMLLAAVAVPLLAVAAAAVLALRVRSSPCGRIVVVLWAATGVGAAVVVGWRCWRRGRRRRGRWVALGARGAGDDFFHLE